MNWEQVKEIANDTNFIVGGHSHSHKILSFLNNKELECEIKSSVNILTQKANVSLKHYSYPEGLQYTFSENVINLLLSYGIKCSPTAEAGINRITDSLFKLKRVMVVGTGRDEK